MNQTYALKTLGILYTICGAWSLITRFALMYLTYLVYNNFGKGRLSLDTLKQKQDRNTKSIDEDDISDIGEYGYINYTPGTTATVPENPEENWTLKDVIDTTYAMAAKEDDDNVKKY